MHKNKKNAFTLVELIVVITILSILWTIAFISLQWYSTQARDSTRISDISSMKSSLELSHVDAWKYPNPSSWIDITYSWAIVWNQWTFWETVYANVNKLDKIPLDPLTDKEYTYSILNNKNEYELWWIVEGDIISMKNELIINTNAVTAEATAYTTGNYNWTMTKSLSWNICNVLSLPTIITNDTSVTDLQDIVTQKKFVYNWYKNLPSSFKSSKFKYDWWFDFTTNKLLAYTDNSSCTPLIDTTSYTARVLLISWLKEAYSWTIIENEWEIKNITSLTISTNNPSQEVLNYAWNFVNNTLGWNIDIKNDKAPTTINITADYVFGTSSPFTTNWNSNPCIVSNITKVTINPSDTIPTTLDANTVYLIKEWSYSVSAMTMNECSALIWEWDVTLTSNWAHAQTVNVVWWNTVISNLKLNWNNWLTTAIIWINNINWWAQSSRHNNTIDNTTVYNFSNYWIYTSNIYYSTYSNLKIHNIWLIWVNLQHPRYNIINKIIAYNNISNWIYLNYWITNILNNITTYNNGDWVLIWNWAYNTLNNVLTYNNTGNWIYSYQQSETYLNNIVWFNNSIWIRFWSTVSLNNFIAYNNNTWVYFDNNYCAWCAVNNWKSYNNIDWWLYSGNSFTSNLKFYWVFNYFWNNRSHGLTLWTWSPIYTNWSSSTAWTFDSTYTIIPSVSWWNYADKNKLTWLSFNWNETYTYWLNIPKQIQPVKDNWSNLPVLYWTNWIDYNTNKYIWEW